MPRPPRPTFIRNTEERSSQGTPSTSTPSRTQGLTSNAHRLLYRGALSLPDSHVLLDGLSFVAETRSGYTPSKNLLDNPLALALESMRGIPSLNLLRTEKLEDIWLDTKNTVSVYIHPLSTLSRIYFDNVLCLEPISSPEGRTGEGVRISLGDNSEPGTDDFLIYGQLVLDDSTPSTSKEISKELHILAARILPAPPSHPNRIPRPDDPTPRKPSAYLHEDNTTGKRKRELSLSRLSLDNNAVKRSKVVEEDERVRKAREVMLHMPKPSKGSKGEDSVFKIPQLPARLTSHEPEEDIFGSQAVVNSKIKHTDVKKATQQPGSDELEKANKTVIKQATVTFLSHRGIKKGDAEFNDFYQTIYRGVLFAMRGILRFQAAKLNAVERQCLAHWRLYADGTGEMSSR